MKKINKFIKNIYPLVEQGNYPIKWETDHPFFFTIEFLSSKEHIEPILKVRKERKKEWKFLKLNKLNNKKYRAKISVDEAGLYFYKIDIKIGNGDIYESEKVYKIYFDRPRARYAAWYEMWPRSQGKIEGKSATFADMINRLTYIHDLGFDTIYLAPIYPTGKTNRKGPNNTLVAGPNDPGSLYSIGNEYGGHKSVNPDFGTMEDFLRFKKEAEKFGIELVLDIVYTCSPDHPWIRKHPEWFFHNPDGTIKYAENPPKKYQDVHPLNFHCDNYQKLWNELRDIFFFWIDKGVKTFRVDNPHTKPVKFWEWIITEIHKKDSAVILLAEAFTEPKMMKLLAKTGFTQSYTYFTWRNTKQEFIDYLTELTNTDMQYYFRGNFFTNTPDILMPILQKAGRPAFKMRVTLAATLSSVYGIYNGFELCENNAILGTEEYMNSEKYQYKVWDWNRHGNIKNYIKKLNKIRRENPALHFYRNLRFHNSSDDNIIFYSKIALDRKNIVFIAINLDPFNRHISKLELPIEELDLEENQDFKIKELIKDEEIKLNNRNISIELSPETEMATIFKIIK